MLRKSNSMEGRGVFGEYRLRSQLPRLGGLLSYLVGTLVFSLLASLETS